MKRRTFFKNICLLPLVQPINSISTINSKANAKPNTRIYKKTKLQYDFILDIERKDNRNIFENKTTVTRTFFYSNTFETYFNEIIKKSQQYKESFKLRPYTKNIHANKIGNTILINYEKNKNYGLSQNEKEIKILRNKAASGNYIYIDYNIPRSHFFNIYHYVKWAENKMNASLYII